MKGELQLLNIKGNMIKEFEFYHGVILAKLVHGINTSVLIQTFPSRSNSSYIVNKNIGLFIKYSTKRMSPWRFSFAKDHQDEILNIKNTLGEVFIMPPFRGSWQLIEQKMLDMLRNRLARLMQQGKVTG